MSETKTTLARTRTPAGMTRINIPLPDELHEDLKVRAVREKTTLQELIAKLLEQAMQPQE